MCVFCTRAFARFAGRAYGLTMPTPADQPAASPPDEPSPLTQAAPDVDRRGLADHEPMSDVMKTTA
jgi:hypothetical protein